MPRERAAARLVAEAVRWVRRLHEETLLRGPLGVRQKPSSIQFQGWRKVAKKQAHLNIILRIVAQPVREAETMLSTQATGSASFPACERKCDYASGRSVAVDRSFGGSR